ncbi:Nitrilase family, member 2 [Seminavis robusta]|uniref:Nitrilase family, member 2 n=1 Tax=Seminavis robusta TaxID=568900 RepID=A0A9N8HK36_9STRA|nr:Nitrilase family, member 2 [Seminavis robusta]|eukprot:Sro728_g193690.1 Nitrilase family, member 2 (280) ;mRNA; f:18098-18937
MAFNLRNYLPADYQVGPHDCIIGRGKKCTQNPGNKRFRAIIQTTLDSYSNAPSKAKKSEIIMEVLSQVKADNGVGFVKQADGGRYIQVEEAASRIAIAQAFRDVLSGTYKSSKKHKQIRHLERKNEKKSQEKSATTSTSSGCEPVSRSIFFSEDVPMPSLVGISAAIDNTSSDLMKPASIHSVLPTSTSFDRFQLHDILNETTSMLLSVEMEQKQGAEEDWEPLPVQASDDIFSKLFTAFGTAEEDSLLCSNPFEPTPLAEGNNNHEFPLINAFAPMAA